MTPILGWKPTVWPLSCDRFLTRELDRLLRDERSPARRAAARLFAQESAARQAAARVQAPRTLLSLGVSALGPPTAGPFPSVAITGLFARSQRGFPTGTTVAPAFDGTIFVGLVPDGVARIRFRATDKPDIEFPVDTNIVVARFSFARSQVGLEQQVWLAADGSVLRTVGRLR